MFAKILFGLVLVAGAAGAGVYLWMLARLGREKMQKGRTPQDTGRSD